MSTRLSGTDSAVIDVLKRLAADRTEEATVTLTYLRDLILEKRKLAERIEKLRHAIMCNCAMSDCRVFYGFFPYDPDCDNCKALAADDRLARALT
jgi:hypothetical protein